MPWESKKQQRWGHGKGGKKAGFTEKKIEEWDEKTDFEDLPEEAEAGKGPTRRQGRGQDTPKAVKDARRISREVHKDVPQKGAGFHSSPKGGKGYKRKEKHAKPPGEANSEELTPVDETYRGISFPLAQTINWNLQMLPDVRAHRDVSFPVAKPNAPVAADLSWGTPAVSRPCGEGEEAYPDKCTEGPGSGVPQSPSYPQQTGRPARPLNDYDRLWHDVDHHLSDAASPQELVERGRQIGLHGPDTDNLLHEMEDRGLIDYEGMDILQEHYQGKWEAANPDPQKGQAMSSIVADLSWSTHKAETFNDTGKDGAHPAWGMKSIIDRGVKTHEKPAGDKRIKDAENQTQKRNIGGKRFRSYSMVGAFNW